MRRSFEHSFKITQQGATLNLPAWGLIPYFALPVRGIDLIVGIEQTIYGEALINLPTPVPANFTVEYTCNIGSASGNNYAINPIVGNIGSHSLTAVFKLGSLVITTQTFNLNVIAAQAGAVSILMLGDSLVYLGNADIATGIDAALVPTITFIGSQGTTVKHEGKSGFSFEAFATNAASPFVKAGVLNIPAYFSDNSLSTPNYVHIRLGVNDCFGLSDVSMSDASRQNILNNAITYAKQIITGFLNYDASIKVIIALPTISEDTGAGWNANYDESVYSIDKYNEWNHRLSFRLLTEFDASAYNVRVLVSNEVVFSDRNDGYQKTSGVHTNGVHPSATGYQQLGGGIATTLNAEAAKAKLPTGLTAVWVNDYAKIDFTDNSAGLALHEIYEVIGAGSYALVTTLAAGVVTYNNYTYQGVSMNFKIRAKYGNWYSDYTSVVNLVTPLVFKATLTGAESVTIQQLLVLTGGSINVNWGDGNNVNKTAGNHTNVSNAYAGAGTYYVKLSGSLDTMYSLAIQGNTKLSGDLKKWQLTRAAYNIYLDNCRFSSMPRGNLNTEFFYMYASQISTAEIDSWLAYANSWYGTNAPTKNNIVYIHVNGVPTGGNNNADRLGIIAKYGAAGKTITVLNAT